MVINMQLSAPVSVAWGGFCVALTGNRKMQSVWVVMQAFSTKEKARNTLDQFKNGVVRQLVVGKPMKRNTWVVRDIVKGRDVQAFFDSSEAFKYLENMSLPVSAAD